MLIINLDILSKNTRIWIQIRDFYRREQKIKYPNKRKNNNHTK